MVYSSAIKSNNPEIKAALEKKIPVLSRADMLAELMKNKKFNKHFGVNWYFAKIQ